MGPRKIIASDAIVCAGLIAAGLAAPIEADGETSMLLLTIGIVWALVRWSWKGKDEKGMTYDEWEPPSPGDEKR